MRFKTMSFRRRLLIAAALTLTAPFPAAATILIGFNDDGSPGASAAVLSDTGINHAVQWTQTVDATGVTLRAILGGDLDVAPVPPSLSWYVTDALGPGTTAANVIASGAVVFPAEPLTGSDLDALPRTTLATGLNLAAGTYYLVFDGPATGFANWEGDFTGITTVLASGFSVGPYFATQTPDAFAPASPFFANTSGGQFVFELETAAAVPEPSTWAMMLLGFSAVGFTMRRKPKLIQQIA